MTNNLRTVSARSSVNSSSAESLHDYTNDGTSLTNKYQTGMMDPYTHHHPSRQQQTQPYTYNFPGDFQPPPATTARRVSEGNDGGDFLSETTMYLAPTYYHGQQHSSYVTHHGHWQHQSSQPPHYSYQQVAPGDVASSSMQRRREISYSDGRNDSISSTSSDAQSSKIVPFNWNTTMGGYPSHQSHEIGHPIKTAPSSSTGSVVDVHKTCDPKWEDIGDADRLLDVLGKIDDEDVNF